MYNYFFFFFLLSEEGNQSQMLINLLKTTIKSNIYKMWKFKIIYY